MFKFVGAFATVLAFAGTAYAQWIPPQNHQRVQPPPAYGPPSHWVLPPQQWQPPPYTWGQLRRDVPILTEPFRKPQRAIIRSIRCHMNHCWEEWSSQ